ncbi:hypothetical protein NLX83_11130 [Allokutzneria sp. A3M-2-11 16]|uniref:hypothetical protein n=1 Tax=Allokutzneria sp. A3M-2-11 16 TaxID=2962043 RepID=UPI0020B8C76B|nr:hypothetical protein [Allokutzneria sp. A3M-2-11 16]MCP3799809.1 hypothetical protein [Allokutzneria sp. A3M-2-11 16]
MCDDGIRKPLFAAAQILRDVDAGVPRLDEEAALDVLINLSEALLLLLHAKRDTSKEEP